MRLGSASSWWTLQKEAVGGLAKNGAPWLGYYALQA